MKQELLKQKEKIEENRRLFGKDYNTDYLDFVFVNEKGDLIKPDHISHSFSDFIKEKNLKKIRLHDLRHSCASIMLANGVQMKQIQEWLGHSNFSTTADVYSHLDFTAKIDSANKIALALETKKEKDTSMDIELLKEKMKTMGINSIEELFLLLNKN
jgi:site-specific recombinase XerD